MVDVRSITYFYSQICKFRELIGSVSFWQKPDQQRAAIIALGHVYGQLKYANDAEKGKAEIAWEATMNEFTRRTALVDLHGMGVTLLS